MGCKADDFFVLVELIKYSVFISLFASILSIFSFSFLIVWSASKVFLANLYMDFTIIRSILPFKAS